MLQEYCTPPGFYDLPYVYVFNPNALFAAPLTVVETIHQIGLIQPVGLNEEYFILRKIVWTDCGVGPTQTTDPAGQGFQYRDVMGKNSFSDYRPIWGGAGNSAGHVYVLPVCPEKIYPRQSSISFDLLRTALNFNGFSAFPVTDADSVPLGQILFWGIRRMKGENPLRQLQAGQSEESYTYLKQITVNWFYYNGGVGSGGLAPLVTFTIPVVGWDFELLDILVKGDQQEPANTAGTARIRLYDGSQSRIPISSAPINLAAINSLETTSETAGTGYPQGLGAIVPGLVYRDQSVIYFDLQSLLSPRDTQSNTITIMFKGKRRYRA